MTVRNLDAVFDPSSVAVIGASEQPGSLGRIVTDNLRMLDICRALGFTVRRDSDDPGIMRVALADD